MIFIAICKNDKYLIALEFYLLVVLMNAKEGKGKKEKGSVGL